MLADWAPHGEQRVAGAEPDRMRTTVAPRSTRRRRRDGGARRQRRDRGAGAPWGRAGRALPLTVSRRPPLVGRTRSRCRTASRIERSRCRPLPITSHTTYSAGSLRRRIVAVPVARKACAIHSASSVSLNSSKLAARSPAPTAENGLPQPHPPPPVGKTNYSLWLKRSRTRSVYALTDRIGTSRRRGATRQASARRCGAPGWWRAFQSPAGRGPGRR